MTSSPSMIIGTLIPSIAALFGLGSCTAQPQDTTPATTSPETVISESLTTDVDSTTPEATVSSLITTSNTHSSTQEASPISSPVISGSSTVLPTTVLSSTPTFTAPVTTNPGATVPATATITLNGQALTFRPADNATAQDLRSLGNLNISMSELNGNEYHGQLPRGLAGTPQRIGQINAGDVLLWSGNTIVIFYESFRTNYSYARLGTIDNPELVRTLAANQSRINAEITW
ncbi:MAG: cyclophilin-like fold protein [Corynebacterium sp.]|nr:cyclophilin-like fold protein [Corynebacterium sp.]